MSSWSNKVTRLGEKLRDIRKKVDHTQKKMSQVLEVSQAFLSAIELGTTPAPKNLSEKLAKAYVLEGADVEEVALLAKLTQKQVTLRDGMTDETKELIHLVIDRWDKFDSDDLRQVINLVREVTED